MRDILIKNGLIVTADDTLRADLLIAGGVGAASAEFRNGN